VTAQAGAPLPAWNACPATQAAAISSVPMSRLEPDKFVDYDTMADKLKARRRGTLHWRGWQPAGSGTADAHAGARARRSSASA
jgi:hypothetical protein